MSKIKVDNTNDMNNLFIESRKRTFGGVISVGLSLEINNFFTNYILTNKKLPHIK